MIKLIKRLFKREPQPDVLLLSPSESSIMVACSKVLHTGRRVVEHRGDILILEKDGAVRGSAWITKWEWL